eukprot:scaffold106679_cov60-Phaeocystis_antarctica.AAC.1
MSWPGGAPRCRGPSARLLRCPQACSRAPKRGFPYEARRWNEASSFLSRVSWGIASDGLPRQGWTRWWSGSGKELMARDRRPKSLCPWPHVLCRRKPTGRRADLRGPGEHDGAARVGLWKRAGAARQAGAHLQPKTTCLRPVGTAQRGADQLRQTFGSNLRPPAHDSF